MSAELLQDNEDIDFVRGRANQLVPPKEETTSAWYLARALQSTAGVGSCCCIWTEEVTRP